jgi:hypothetical protein
MSTEIHELEVTPRPVNLPQNADIAEADPRSQVDTGFSYRPDGRGVDPHLTVADLLERRGAFFEGELVEVVSATMAGASPDGTPEGEALVRQSVYESPQYVSLGELAVPARHELRRELNATTQVPEMYECAIRKREQVIDACPIDFYTASSQRSWAWPWKLTSYHEARPNARKTSDTLVVDSGVKAWGSPDDVLQAAANVEADWVFATDVTGMEDPGKSHHNAAEYPDPEEYGSVFDAAMEGLRRFMERAREVGCLDKTVLPIQPDYVEFLEACDERGWLDEVGYIAVGGLLTISDVNERIEALRDVREYVGDEMDIHALAPGTDLRMMWELRQHPELVDSLDVSTPERATSNNKLPDATWGYGLNADDQAKHVFPRGEGVSIVRGVGAELVSLQAVHMLGMADDAAWEEAFTEADAPLPPELVEDDEPDAEPAAESEPGSEQAAATDGGSDPTGENTVGTTLSAWADGE